MNRIAKWMMRLYPAAWRARYGDEMEALLADSGADVKTIGNLLTGGLRMRFSTGSFMKMALVLGFAGMILGIGASYLQTPQYESQATLILTPVHVSPSASQRDISTQLNALTDFIQREQIQVESRRGLLAIINDPRLNLYNDERKHTPLEDVIDKMRADIGVAYLNLPLRPAVAFDIRFTYPDKLKAQQTVNALKGAFMAQNQSMQIGVTPGYVLQVLGTASLPVSPMKPNRYQFGLSGCLLGFLLAGIIAVVKRAGHALSTPMLAMNE